jgi:hypothetical protein
MNTLENDDLDREAEESIQQVMEGLRRYFGVLLKLAAARNTVLQEEQ